MDYIKERCGVLIESFIKYFTLLFCCAYTFKKLLNLKLKTSYLYVDLFIAALLSLSVFYLRLYFAPLSIPAMIIIFIIYIQLITKTQLELTITAAILSFGISFASFIVSAVFSSAVYDLLGIKKTADYVLFLTLGTALLQLLFSTLPFKFKRLKNGMPFLMKKGASNAGVLTSVILLCCFILISNNKDITNYIYLIPIVFILISAVLILFWWRGHITNMYLERLKTDEIRRLKKSIKEKNERIKQLESHNETLAKIIHKDNKLIPAMELAVEEFLQTFEQRDSTFLQEKGQMLLKQLKDVCKERSGIITDYQFAGKKLPVTGVITIDAVMNYMFNKAREHGIEFELTLSGSVKFMTENIASISDITTLLADLIENAITAVNHSASKKILVLIGIVDNCYIIDVFDSGIPFEPETFESLGQKKVTTHADSGGSGIGLMTTLEILKRYNASFAIEEYTQSCCIYTKKVAAVFDNLNQFNISTEKNNDIYTKRNLNNPGRAALCDAAIIKMHQNP